jgi:four helix bundle protein
METPKREHMPIERTSVFARYQSVAQEVWSLAMSWPPFVQNTLGSQLVRAADSVGANLVEGDGRPTDGDGIRFFGIARSSARETSYWISVASTRGFISGQVAEKLNSELNEAGKMLNGLISYRRQYRSTHVKETQSDYAPDHGSTEHLMPNA